MFAKNTEGAGNFVYGVLNSINQIVFNDRVSAGVTIAIGSLIYLLIAILLRRFCLSDCIGICLKFESTQVREFREYCFRGL